eukprot:Gb_01310 [translate_table: standard]
MPAMSNLLSRWIPVEERSRSLALVYSGMYLGSVTGLAFSPMLIHKFGWPSVFFSFGSLGALWFATWQSNSTYKFFFEIRTNKSVHNLVNDVIPHHESHAVRNIVDIGASKCKLSIVWTPAFHGGEDMSMEFLKLIVLVPCPFFFLPSLMQIVLAGAGGARHSETTPIS